MLDLGWTELAIVAVIALMVIGPKDLPKVLRTLGQWTRRLRGLAREFQGHIDEVIRDAELDDVRDGIKKARRTNIGSSINKMVDPDGTVTRELNDIGRRPGGGRTGETRKQTLDYDGAGDPTGPAPDSAPQAAPDPAPAASETPARAEDDPKPGAPTNTKPSTGTDKD
ncbi:Sec-independent protein translocase protein TatB [Roseospira navarrensis]|uniref:Sec-independent protein translocase protein TatB n=1 Tax=Roseospira navarrensis TaxID=140058 RepID=A0A7X2D2A9_9PROT|nr:Sec-independent protein translocase protein TatB [Roseospira navarrensis]MQX35573.1 twin-arginine translocase subunit TatB [Roseospira navarrensis]